MTTDQVIADRDTLIRGWQAIRDVDAHDLDGCVPCRRYAATLLRGGQPRDFYYMRCKPMQDAQKAINAADEIARTIPTT